jgi:predicted AAA+ superfamily ATPase
MQKRTLNLSKILAKKHSAFLLGARGVGKTRLANAFIEESKASLTYNLLEFETYQRLLHNPAQLSKEVTAKLNKTTNLTILIDEIQKCPALLDEIHNLIELYKGRIQFLLTGSSARKLKRGGANLLAGRALNLKLHPISQIEDPQLDLESVLEIGSLPGVLYENDNPKATLRSYVETYLKEEILQESLVRRIDSFSRFLEVAAQYHAQIVNVSSIAKSAGVSSNTVSQYFQILEDTLLGWRLPGWSASVRKQLRFAPKFYFFDNGVCNALRGDLNSRVKAGTSRYGDLFESWIIQECMRTNSYQELDLRFSYWHTSNGQEVDLIVSKGAGAPLAAIEIKSGNSPVRKDISGLKSFSSEYPQTALFCLCQTPNEYEISDIKVLPWRAVYDLLKQISES